jgi:hypothetical protein
MPLEEILDKEIIVLKYMITDSKFSGYGKTNDNGGNKCLKLQFELNGVHHITFTGSGVLMDLCEKYKDQMPFICRIVKTKNYYTFAG